MPYFYSPDGNCEVWDEQPEGYIPYEEWQAKLQAEQQAKEAEELAIYENLLNRALRLREARNQRLGATDYLMMPDYPLTEEFKKALIAYRQALRDLPAQEGAPWDGGGEDTPWPKYPTEE